MLSYHFSPSKSKYVICKAQKRSCPYAASLHISQEAFEGMKDSSYFVRDTSSINMDPFTWAKEQTPLIPKTAVGLAPEGLPGPYCFACQHYFSEKFFQQLTSHQEGEEVLQCENCSSKTYFDLVGVDLRYNEQHLMTEAGVKNNHWFHITKRPNWTEDINSYSEDETPLVHIGSKLTAVARMKDLLRTKGDHSNNKWYLYELKIKPTTKVNRGVHVDAIDSWPETYHDAVNLESQPYCSDGVSRYLNLYESPGSISLLANPKSFELVTVVEIPFN